MTKVKLPSDQWWKIRSFLDENPKVYVGQERQCRRFIEGVLWMTRSGAQRTGPEGAVLSKTWRLLPKRYGNWNSVYKRFDRWSERDIWREMVEHFADDPDMERLMMDSSVIRAHACAAGAGHKRGGKKRKHLATAEAGLVPKST